MVRVVLRGGLGNQLWQFNAAYAIASRSGSGVVIDRSFLDAYADGSRRYWLDSFELDSLGVAVSERTRPRRLIRSMGPVRRLRRRVLGVADDRGMSPGIVDEDVVGTPTAVERLLDLRDVPRVLIGYFEDERIRSLSQAAGFPTPLPLRRPTLDLLRSVTALRSSGAASIHVRLGDFPPERRISPRGLVDLLDHTDATAGLPDEAWVFSDEPEGLEPYLKHLRPRFGRLRVWEVELTPPELVHLMAASSVLITGDSTFGQWAGHWCREAGGRWLVAPLNPSPRPGAQ